MKITPIDIRQQQFGRTLRGLDPREVDSFLNLVSDELEAALRENNRIKDELARTGRIVEEYRDRERALKETMITAQKITDDIKESARKEAEVILSQAEIQAEKIIHAANDRLIKVIEDINEMKRQREQLRANLVGVVEAHRRLLQQMHEEKMESLFLGVDELRQRKSRLFASLLEALEAQANLLELDRNHQVDELREEVVRLERERTNFISRIQGVIDTHTKLLEVRDEAEGRPGGFHVENNLKVLKRQSEPRTEEGSGAKTERAESEKDDQELKTPARA